MKMINASLLLPLSLAMCACQSLSPSPVVRYLKVEGVKVPDLEPALRERRDPTSCRKLLQLFLVSQENMDSLCGTITASSNGSISRDHTATGEIE
jgi:hypothetical protein